MTVLKGVSHGSDEERREKLFRKWLPETFILVWARSAGQALGILQRADKRTFAGILLDHDLDQSWRVESDANLDGRDVVAKIIEKNSWDVPILVHSNNPKDAPEMVASLESAGFSVTRYPFYALEQDNATLLEWVEEVVDNWE